MVMSQMLSRAKSCGAGCVGYVLMLQAERSSGLKQAKSGSRDRWTISTLTCNEQPCIRQDSVWLSV